MPITQEQARAELARRGISPPTNQSGITREQAIAELQRRGIQPLSPPIAAINQSFPQQTQGQGGVTQAMKVDVVSEEAFGVAQPAKATTPTSIDIRRSSRLFISHPPGVVALCLFPLTS